MIKLNKYWQYYNKVFIHAFIWGFMSFIKNPVFWIKRNLNRISKRYRPINSRIKRGYNKNRSWDKRIVLCHAPFKNLYLQQDGRVIGCCYNRFDTFGKYPQSTISDIWKGEKLTKFRNSIINEDLPPGCGQCFELLKAGNYNGVHARIYDNYFMGIGPTTMDLELENTCNLECIMCSGLFSSSIRRNKEKMPPTPKIYDESFVNSLEKFIPNLKNVNFFGGEPFLIKIYYSIWERIIELNPHCSLYVQTNGTILTEKMKLLLAKGNFRIGISLDSINKEIYEKIRVNARFESVMKNIDFFSGYARNKGFYLSIAVCPIRMNWKEIPEIIKYCNRINAIITLHTVIYPLHLALWNLKSTELIEIYEFLSSNIISDNSTIERQNQERFNAFLYQVKTWHNEALHREKNVLIYNKMNFKQLETILLTKLNDKVFNNESHNKTQVQKNCALNLKNIIDSIGSIESRKRVLIEILNLPDAFKLFGDNSDGIMPTIISEYIVNQAIDEANFSIKH